MAARGARAGFKGPVLAAMGTMLLGAVSVHAHAQSAPAYADSGLRGSESGFADAMQSGSESGLAAGTQTSGEATGAIGDPTDAADPAYLGDAVSAPNPAPSGAANYGKPRPQPDPRLAYPGRPKIFAHPLPPLQPYATAPALRPHGGPLPGPADENPPPTIAQTPSAPVKPRPKVETDPYAPLGIDAGSLRLDPYIELDAGYDSNPDRTQTGAKGSAFLHGETGLTATSLWSRHQLTAELRAGYYDYLSTPDANRPEGDGKIDLRLDATRNTTLDFEARGTLDTQRPGSPGVAATVQGRPLVVGFGATAGATRTVGRVSLGLHGTIDREAYQDGRLADGTIVPLSSENYVDYGLQARAGYEITPGLKPFVEADLDTRRHDQMVDSSGFARNSNGIAGQIGSTFELSRILTGTLSGGYLQRRYADARLGTLSGPTFNSALVWAATPLTTLTLTGVTTIGETTVANASGEVSRIVSLGVSHALLRNLTLTGLASYGTNTYQGVSILEKDYLATLGFKYSLTRSVVLNGTFTHVGLVSTLAGSSYTDDMVMLGVRLQR